VGFVLYGMAECQSAILKAVLVKVEEDVSGLMSRWKSRHRVRISGRRTFP
jgi:hypothetical protein